jgi:TetR/AcrR family transcriptional repressor of nem operon
MPRPKQFDEDLVLSRALETFWSQGYERTSISDLETATGLGRQSLYNTYGDKHALFLRVLDTYAEQSGALVGSTLLAAPGGAASIRAFFAGQVRSLTEEGKPRRACLILNTVQEFGGRDPAVRARCSGSTRALETAFAHALRAGVAAGDLPEDLDVAATARMLQAQSYGLAVLSKAGATPEQLSAAAGALLGALGM